MERQTVNPWTWQDRSDLSKQHAVYGAGRTVHCAGQTSVDPDGNPIYAGENERRSCGQALENLKAVLREWECELADVVRLNYDTTDLDAFFPALDVGLSRG